MQRQVVSVSRLLGMFAEHAMHKLQDIAVTLFGASPDIAKPSAKAPAPHKQGANDKLIEWFGVLSLCKMHRLGLSIYTS